MLTDDRINELWNASTKFINGYGQPEILQFARAIEAEASPASAPEGWKHSCNALCLDDVELWIPQCPHCGKPASTLPVQDDRKDAERYNKLVAYLVSDCTDFDDAIVAARTRDEMNTVIDTMQEEP